MIEFHTGDPAHAVRERAAVADVAGLLHDVAERVLDLARLRRLALRTSNPTPRAP